MTKQEEIREGMVALFHEMGLGETIDSETFQQRILFYLHSQGVVIKVERELPKVRYTVKVYDNTDSRNIGYAFRKAYEQAGYVATEPLVNIKS